MADAREWKRRVGEWKRSGLTADEFAASGGFSPQQLRNWASKFGVRVGQRRAKAARVPAIQLLRVLPRKQAPVPLTAAFLRVQIGKALMEIPAEFDESVLRRVVAVLSAAAEEVR